jgi:hypothetical protein
MEKDPNTIWESQESQYNTFPSSYREINMTDDSLLLNYNTDATEATRSVHKTITSFWKKYSVQFRDFWLKMEPKSRENFLREIQPNIVQSLSDRYTIIDGKKVYERRYDTLLLLTPVVTVEFMMAENNLTDCFQEWAKEDALILNSSDIVVNLRELYSQGLYPFTQSELMKYKTQLDLKKGDHVVLNAQGKFGQWNECNDPDYPTARGTPVEGTDFEVNLYRMGIMCHPIEFNLVLENLNFMMYLLINAIDEFRDEVLEKKKKALLNSSVFVCANCFKTASEEGKGLLPCSACMITFYCSKTCQTTHWKPHHKKECQKIKKSYTPESVGCKK